MINDNTTAMLYQYKKTKKNYFYCFKNTKFENIKPWQNNHDITMQYAAICRNMLCPTMLRYIAIIWPPN